MELAMSTPPTYKITESVFPKACPRDGCNGDIGRFSTYGPDEFKCLMCAREMKRRKGEWVCVSAR